MHPAIRTQGDFADNGDDFSEQAGIDVSAGDRARQEFKQEADINFLMSRYGVGAAQRQPTYGAVDYTLDLQQALNAVAEAKQAYRRMPPKLKERYPTWQELLTAVESGQLVLDLTGEGVKVTPPPKEGEGA